MDCSVQLPALARWSVAGLIAFEPVAVVLGVICALFRRLMSWPRRQKCRSLRPGALVCESRRRKDGGHAAREIPACVNPTAARLPSSLAPCDLRPDRSRPGRAEDRPA